MSRSMGGRPDAVVNGRASGQRGGGRCGIQVSNK